ncbi:unnamed protein product, partial [Ectocarpus fasciculatus]
VAQDRYAGVREERYRGRGCHGGGVPGPGEAPRGGGRGRGAVGSRVPAAGAENTERRLRRRPRRGDGDPVAARARARQEGLRAATGVGEGARPRVPPVYGQVGTCTLRDRGGAFAVLQGRGSVVHPVYRGAVE